MESSLRYYGRSKVMGFGYGTRSPEQVQRDNGGRFTFDTIQARYEAIKPISGKRKDLNVRPLNERRRDWERVFKVNDNEYYISHDAWRGHQDNDIHNRSITWFKRGDFEIVVVHTPKSVWNKENPHRLAYYQLSSPSIFYFYDYNLPIGLSMANYKSCKYVAVNREDGQINYYSAEHGDITFQRRSGDKYWNPVVVHREFKHSLDRSKTKELRKSLEPFLEYYKVVEPLIDKTSYYYGNALEDFGSGVFNKVGDDVPESWFKIVERYKHKNQWYRGDVKNLIIKDLYQVAKPLVKEPVPLGTPVRDRYRTWVR